MSFEKSEGDRTEQRMMDEKEYPKIEIGNIDSQSQCGLSEAHSHLGNLKNEMVAPYDEKSTVNFPDNKSMFSQFDVMSQYSHYIEEQH